MAQVPRAFRGRADLYPADGGRPEGSHRGLGELRRDRGGCSRGRDRGIHPGGARGAGAREHPLNALPGGASTSGRRMGGRRCRIARPRRPRVRSGDRVPADLRGVETIGLQCDESALTGESVPVTKSVDPVGLDAGIGDRSSMLFSGTIITSGTATGIVTATGARTQLGNITAMVSDVEQLQTPLAAQLGRLAKRISVVIGVLAALILLVGRLVHDFPFDELLSAAIGFAVAAVPEGLPALVTITL